MRRIRYSVAASLDGFIAGPSGQYDWIVMDDEIDFQAYDNEFDVVLMGRRSYEATGGGAWQGMKTLVVSKTLRQSDHPEVTIVSGDLGATLAALRSESGKDIWLFGGGQLFRTLLDLGLVDIVEVAVMPVLLGEGTSLLAPPYAPTKLSLVSHKRFKSGIAWLTYSLLSQAGNADRHA